VDQYESSVRGCLPNSKGKESFGNKYAGGTIFYNHASGYIKCIHQVSLCTLDTIIAKNLFEQEAKTCGVRVLSYHRENGIFKSKEFSDALQSLNQTIRFSGIGAHHQNGVAERAIRIVTEQARTMMHHAFLHWSHVFSTDFWPYALDDAKYIYNHISQRDRGWALIELFCSVTFRCEYLQRIRVWGSPVYDGIKIPKWEPRACQGQSMGFSLEHSSLVGLVCNLITEYISPQYHMVFDELFTTVHSAVQDENQQDQFPWLDLFVQY
jgi:hypothetical protein